MKFLISARPAMMNIQSLTPEQLVAGAQLAEQLGFWGVHYEDHPVPTKTWLEEGGTHAYDPFVLLSLIANGTGTIKLLTNKCIGTYRNPLLTANMIATLDWVSGGRFQYGTAAGYLEDEFKALGADFENRNALFDEYLALIQRALTGELINQQGESYQATNIAPIAANNPVPIWIGGNSNRAIRRSVEFGDVWSPFAGGAKGGVSTRTPSLYNKDALKEKIRYLRDYESTTRSKDLSPVEISFLPRRENYDFTKEKCFMQFDLEDLYEYKEMGVDYILCFSFASNYEEHLEFLTMFKENIIDIVK